MGGGLKKLSFFFTFVGVAKIYDWGPSSIVNANATSVSTICLEIQLNLWKRLLKIMFIIYECNATGTYMVG